MTALDLDPVAETRELLAKATPGPWSFEPGGMYECGDHCCTEFWDNRVLARRGAVVTESWELSFEDAELIAAAPRLLAALVAEVERLREQLADVDVPMPEPPCYVHDEGCWDIPGSEAEPCTCADTLCPDWCMHGMPPAKLNEGEPDHE